MVNLLMIYDMVEPTNIDSKEKIGRFCERNGIGFRAKLTADVVSKDIKWCDLVWGIRIQSEWGSSILEIAKINKCVIIAMYDDNFLAIKDYKIRRYFSYKAIIRVLQLADYVVSCNDSLGKKMLNISNNARYVRTDTTISLNEINKPVIKNTDILKVVYYVNDGSTEVFKNIFNPVIENMPLDIIGKFELNLIGVRPLVARADEIYKINYIEKCPLEEFRTLLRNGSFTFGIAPLDSSEFSKAKYINKFFEFSMAGIPGIYSNVEPYSLKIIDGYDGILADNNAADWLAAIQRMQDMEVRRTCISNAQSELKEIYSEAALDRKLLEDIKEFSCYEASHEIRRADFWIRKIKGKAFCIAESFARAYGRWKIEGLGSVIRWTYKRYVKRDAR